MEFTTLAHKLEIVTSNFQQSECTWLKEITEITVKLL